MTLVEFNYCYHTLAKHDGGVSASVSVTDVLGHCSNHLHSPVADSRTPSQKFKTIVADNEGAADRAQE